MNSGIFQLAVCPDREHRLVQIIYRHLLLQAFLQVLMGFSFLLCYLLVILGIRIFLDLHDFLLNSKFLVNARNQGGRYLRLRESAMQHHGSLFQIQASMLLQSLKAG